MDAEEPHVEIDLENTEEPETKSILKPRRGRPPISAERRAELSDRMKKINAERLAKAKQRVGEIVKKVVDVPVPPKPEPPVAPAAAAKKVAPVVEVPKAEKQEKPEKKKEKKIKIINKMESDDEEDDDEDAIIIVNRIPKKKTATTAVANAPTAKAAPVARAAEPRIVCRFV